MRAMLIAVASVLIFAPGVAFGQRVDDLVRTYKTYNSPRQSAERSQAEAELLALGGEAHAAIRDEIVPLMVREYNYYNSPRQSTERIAMLQRFARLGVLAVGAASSFQHSARSESAAEQTALKRTVEAITTTSYTGQIVASDATAMTIALRRPFPQNGEVTFRWTAASTGGDKVIVGNTVMGTYDVRSLEVIEVK